MLKGTNSFIVIILAAVCLCLSATPEPSYASDITATEIRLTRDKIERLEDDVSQYKTEIGRIQDRVKRYESMAEDARRQAEASKAEIDKNHYLKNAAARQKRADDLKQDIASFEQKIAAKKNELAGLRERLKSDVQAEQRHAAERQQPAAAAETQKTSPKPSGENEALYLPLEKLIGMWELAEKGAGFDPGILAIVPTNPESEEYAHDVTLYTTDAHRVWEGKYHSAQELDADAMVTLSYKPKADEMNPDIPKWAREQIEGELEWKLELQPAGSWGTPEFVAKFYPGKVEWNEKALVKEGKSAWVVGKGEPSEYTYTRVLHEVLAYTYGAPELHVRMEGAPQGDIRPIEGLVKRQEFIVEVYLPPELAKQRGETLTVDIKGLKNGDSTTLELKAGKIFDDRMTTYSHPTAVTIANRGDQRVEDYKAPKFSLNWVLGNTHPGSRLGINIANEEEVEFSYDGSSVTLPVYNSLYQRGIARHKAAMQTLRGFFAAMVSDPKYAAKARDEATQKLQMLKNYEAVLNSETAHDRIRYAVGMRYFGSDDAASLSLNDLVAHFDATGKPVEGVGLIGKTNAYIKDWVESTGSLHGQDWIGAYNLTKPLSDEARKGSNHKSGYFDGALWTSPYERAVIEKTALSARDRFREEVYDELPLAFAYAIYSGIAMASEMDNAVTVYTFFYSMYENWWYRDKFNGTGINIMGKKVHDAEVLQSALALGTSGVHAFALPVARAPNTPQARAHKQPSNFAKRVRESTRTSLRQAYEQPKHPQYQAMLDRLNKVPAKHKAKLQPTIDYRSAEPIDSWNNPIKCAGNKATDATVVDIVNKSGSDLPPPKAAPPRPAEFKPTTVKSKIADDVTPKELNEVNTWYSNVQAVGKKIAPAQEHGMCNCMFWMPFVRMLNKIMLRDVDAFILSRQLFPGFRPVELVHGMKDKISVALAQAMGLKVIYDKLIRRQDWEIISHYLDEGFIVRGTVKPNGQTAGLEGNHAVAIKALIRDAKGKLELITFYDPAFGRDITLKIRDYERIEVSGYGLFMLHPSKKPKLVELLEGAEARYLGSKKAKPTIVYPKPKPSGKPVIVYPEGHPNAPKPKKPANDNTPAKGLDETWHDGDAMPAPRLNRPKPATEPIGSNSETSAPKGIKSQPELRHNGDAPKATSPRARVPQNPPDVEQDESQEKKAN